LASLMVATSSTSVASSSSNTGGEAPRPESYSSYFLYIQALFDYQKARNSAQSSATDKLCRSENDALAKKNTCQQRATITTTESNAAQYESIEDAINNKANNPINLEGNTRSRSTFSSFPLNPITAQDLSQTGVDGLLGLFNNLALEQQTKASADRQINDYNDPSTSIGTGISNEIASALYTQVVNETLAMGGNIILRDGSGHAEVMGRVAGTGLQLQLSSSVRTGLYIVDRDGYPGSAFYKAGAVTVSSLGINVPNMLINIQGVNRTSSNPDLVGIQINSPEAITVDMSGTTIGAAYALADGSKIGPATNFLSFGPRSVLTIAPGMTMNTAISRPNGTITPFVTLNGNLGKISLQEISLIDNGGSAFNIGMLGIDGISFINTKIYIDDQRIILDAGTGIKNASVSIERMSLGNTVNTTSLGDLYVNHINLNAQMTIEAH